MELRDYLYKTLGSYYKADAEIERLEKEEHSPSSKDGGLE